MIRPLSHEHFRRRSQFALLDKLVGRRARGEPLQYILGDQPFGDLEILCRRDVLIPRTDTETYTASIVNALSDMQILGPEPAPIHKKLRILDLCTGTGCITLLLHRLIHQELEATAEPGATARDRTNTFNLEILGLDLSIHAVNLSLQNLTHNVSKGLLDPSASREVTFRQADVMKLDAANVSELYQADVLETLRKCDIVVSNPPYVAPVDFAPGGRTENSVRKFEPQMALVPPCDPNNPLPRQDTFYPHIIGIGRHAQASLIVMEVADGDQARRVRCMVWSSTLLKDELRVETWFDDGRASVNSAEDDLECFDTSTIPETRARAVVVWIGKWALRRKVTMRQ